MLFYYSATVLQTSGIKDPWAGSLVLLLVNFLAVLCIMPLVDRWERRNLLAVSSALITLTFVYLDKTEEESKEHKDWGIGMITCMVFNVISFEVGLGPIPWVLVAEMTPFEYRGSIVATAQVVDYLCSTIVVATLETLFRELHHFIFVPFGCICAVGAVLIFCFFPETMQKTTEQIVNDMDPTFYQTKCYNKYIVKRL